MNIETIWNNIKSNEGETFRTIRGVEYTYVVVEDYIPLTVKHESEALVEAGFSSVVVLNNWGATYTIKAVK